MKKSKKILLSLLITILVIVGGSLVYVKQATYQPTETAEKSAASAKENNDALYFPPASTSEKPMILFYSGALVTEKSYSIWAEQLAQAGYPVYLLQLPMHLAIFSPNAAKKIVEKNPSQDYIIGGHSLGGVMASRFAAQTSDSQLKGIFYLASYPDEKGSLADKNLSALSVTATNDEVLNQKTWQESQKFLPADTTLIEIRGGNHAGFGSYGKQKGDGTAAISNNQQQEMLTDILTTWLEKF
ncbi:alpha/beta hydrolase [Enterococcus timonensis]|uniref:alpha/beta hydrolase n=1 Tax=Enterococcus timonensis TaxID=1852364 RepID=UPI0008D9FFED|nr:alpha/beta hydrolase [Enterococcus timonensis]